jgi:hypothetical protein
MYDTVLWDGQRESVRALKIQKGFFIQLKGCIKERLVDQFLKS